MRKGGKQNWKNKNDFNQSKPVLINQKGSSAAPLIDKLPMKQITKPNIRVKHN
jgi:hypothetical protein